MMATILKFKGAMDTAVVHHFVHLDFGVWGEVLREFSLFVNSVLEKLFWTAVHFSGTQCQCWELNKKVTLMTTFHLWRLGNFQ